MRISSSSRLISELTTDSDWKQDYVYLNGRLVAKIVNRERGGGGGQAGPMGPGGPGEPPGGTRPDVEVFWNHLDHLGTPLVMTDSNKNEAWRGDYYPFGELYRETVSQNNLHRFPGQLEDEESDLYYNWHRYYDPKIGRYRQADPIGLAGLDYNLYRYVGSDPINYIDPFGLWRFSVTVFIPTSQVGFGFGGTVSFGSSKGTNFLDATLGVGVGAGLSWNPDSEVPAHLRPSPESCDDGVISIGVRAFANASFALGPLVAKTGLNARHSLLEARFSDDPLRPPTIVPRYSTYDFFADTDWTTNWGFGLGLYGGVGGNLGVSW